MKVVIPLAGLGTRMRPQTHSKAKPMVRLAGKPILGHLLDWAVTDRIDEVILIVSPHQTDVEPYARAATDRPLSIVVQPEPRGQAHAIDQVRDMVDGPLLVIFSDTFADSSFNELSDVSADGIIYVKRVADPSRFGVVVVRGDRIADIIEKPTTPVGDLAIVGIYYFPQSRPLFDAITRVLDAPPTQNDEYFIADALKLMIADGRTLAPREVAIWEDTGTPDATLQAHRYLLDRSGGHHRSRPTVTIVPPVFIADDAHVSSSVIGPYVSIESGCRIERSVLSDCILDEQATVTNRVLTRGLLGRRVTLVGSPESLNVADDSTIHPPSADPLPRL
jgi:glucose-1-phosphate thymidylyltransferase